MFEQISQLLYKLNSHDARFVDVLALIEQHYNATATAFDNGAQHNAANQNQGSAKVLYFAQLHDLNHEQTLRLFAEHYQAVLQNPNGDDHQNIRQFMQHGWDGVRFDGVVLLKK